MVDAEGWIGTRETSMPTGPTGARPPLDAETLDRPIAEAPVAIARMRRARHACEDLPIPESEDPAQRTAVLRTLAQSPGAAAALAGLYGGIMSLASSLMIDLRPHYV
jgi:hypothetical protein